MFKWGANAEGASAGRMSRTGPSHISNIVLSIVKIGPPEKARTDHSGRGGSPNRISKMVLSTFHLGPLTETRTT